MKIDVQRGIHIKRLPEQLLGMTTASVVNLTEKEISGKASKLQKSVLENLSDTIRYSSPTISLVDVELMYSTLLDIVIEDYLAQDGEDSNYLNVLIPKAVPTDTEKYDTVGPNSDRYATAYKEAVELLAHQAPRIVESIRTAITTGAKEVTYSHISAISERVHTAYNKEIAPFLAAEQSGKTIDYGVFQRAGILAGREFSKSLSNLGTYFYLSDGASIFPNIGSRLAFGSRSFDGLRKNYINPKFDKTLEVLLSGMKTPSGFIVKPKDSLKIGYHVHFGHAGLFTSSNGKKDAFIGINTPLVAMSGIFTGESTKLEVAVGTLPLHIEYGIELDTKYTESARHLLDLQVNFAVSQPISINSAISTQESRLRRALVLNYSTKELTEIVNKNLIKSETLMEELLLGIHGSPSLADYIADNIEGLLKGEKPLKVVKTSSAKTTSKSTVGKNPTKKIIGSKPKIPAQKTAPKKKLNLSNRAKGAANSLAALQVLLMFKIGEQVKKNMGTGGSRKVLNYRTGRFAESVKVTRLTQSREGMVSAFYSYMKNPYATFSEGGKQQYPRSRDPKLLISKSIRDIAATAAYNRLRAVLV